MDEKLSQKEATKMKEPPCHLGGLYKAGRKKIAQIHLIDLRKDSPANNEEECTCLIHMSCF